MSAAQQLPTEVLVQILRLAEVRHRLSSGALVNSTWAAAATAATDSVQLNYESEYDMFDLTWWLEQHGKQISRLQLHAGWQEVPYLPCSHLRDLEVLRGELHLQHSDRYYSNMLEATTGLTTLVIQYSTMLSALDSLTVLTALTDLQHLVLQNVMQTGYEDGALTLGDGVWVPIPGSLFSQLVQLTHLELYSGTGGLTHETFEHLSCLTALQYLRFGQMWTEPPGDVVPTAEGLVGLSQLTQLTCLEMYECMATIRTDNTPLLTPLTNLRRLYLFDIDAMDPAVLAGMRQLQYLKLYSAELLGQPSGVAALLAALQGLTQLTHLELHYGDTPEQEAAAPAPAAPPAAAEAPPPPAAAAAEAQPAGEGHADAAARPYAALTASTQLQVLSVDFYTLPPGVWQHVFAPGKLLPHLTSFEAGSSKTLSGGLGCMTSADLAGLVRCCPRLASIQLDWLAFQPGVSLAPLQQLSALTKLHAFGAQDQMNADILAQVAQLAELKCSFIG